jgi:hypothetical protein
MKSSNGGKMAVSETEIMRQIQTLSKGPVRLFRNNVGFDAQNKVKYGLMPGSSDLIGWTQIEIKSNHVGKNFAIFTAIEVKSEFGRIRPEQQNFVDYVNQSGGIAGICRNIQEAKALLSLS